MTAPQPPPSSLASVGTVRILTESDGDWFAAAILVSSSLELEVGRLERRGFGTIAGSSRLSFAFTVCGAPGKSIKRKGCPSRRTIIQHWNNEWRLFVICGTSDFSLTYIPLNVFLPHTQAFIFFSALCWIPLDFAGSLSFFYIVRKINENSESGLFSWLQKRLKCTFFQPRTLP